jgi:hypothetical protein
VTITMLFIANKQITSRIQNTVPKNPRVPHGSFIITSAPLLHGQ